MTRETKKFVAENVLGSTEVQEMLLINRSRLKAIVDAGKLVPIKELKRKSVFICRCRTIEKGNVVRHKNKFI